MSPYNYRCAILLGIGLALSPIHNTWLTKLVTSGGIVDFFLPSFGTAIWLIGSLVFVTWNWESIKEIGWGDKRVFVPLLVIVGAIGLSGITANRWTDKLSPVLMGLSMFSLYLSARVLGQSVFIPLAIGAVIASLGVIVHAVIFPGRITGGFVFEGNYDIIVGYVLLGVALFISQYQWILIGLASVAIFFTGSPEGVFAVGVTMIIILWRRDWGKRLIITVLANILVIVLWFGIGYGRELYSYTAKVVISEPTVCPLDSSELSSGDSSELSAIAYRLAVIQRFRTNLKPLGDGYNLTHYTVDTVHNVPLVIVQQLGYPGLLAGIAWLWVLILCLVKTKWKYAWSLVLTLSVFDHFIWTQLAPWFWAIVGVSTVSNIDNDLAFRKAVISYVEME